VEEDLVKKNYGHYLRARDVARILDMSPDHVLELARSGKLRGEKQGRWWRFSLDAVEAYRKTQEQELALRLSSFD
jgi:excisionase family DNA binding protein